ncbi:HNH endonuclease signature motif containing protein [Proteiniphilum sp.]|uniref:HNH endonuclease signature motif containing protein n=1 Tax=Proteiniphilum sp. TaxID=1926877 RepID=UPI002B1E90AB|nr:HNH endonuclease signature motif containing protein [Proteiniphilum sp.]MEA4915902.1 HNH endonuclease signature motif containing protein [Proteiniphilum sp.]
MWDFIRGTVDAVVHNISLGVLSSSPNSVSVSNADHYNAGRATGDIISIAIGSGEIINGSVGAIGGAAVTVGSGGTATVVGVPVAAASILEVAHGAGTVTTAIKSLTTNEGRVSGKYDNIPNPKNVGSGKKTTPSQRQKILEKNKEQNNGVLRSDGDGRLLNPPSKSTKGRKADMNQAEVDHINPRSKGGTNESSNMQVLSKEENLKKGNR